MTLVQAIILGIIQGATEFIPISSSGHLVLAPHYFGWNIDPELFFIFSVLVQVSTLIAVIIYFWTDLIEIIKSFFVAARTNNWKDNHSAMLGVYIIIATIPAGIAGLLLENTVENAFNNTLSTSIFLVFTGLLLLVSDRFQRKTITSQSLGWLDAVIIGFFQILAIFPGISRSGATISGGLSRGMERRDAARFSFLMSIPIMLAAGFLALLDLIKSPIHSSQILVFISGFITSGVIGYLSIRWLLRFVASRSMNVFAIYCILLGSISIMTLIL